jgi:hypothetical protein
MPQTTQIANGMAIAAIANVIDAHITALLNVSTVSSILYRHYKKKNDY